MVPLIERSVARVAVPVKLPTNPPVDVVTPATVRLPIPACPFISTLPLDAIFNLLVANPLEFVPNTIFSPTFAPSTRSPAKDPST